MTKNFRFHARTARLASVLALTALPLGAATAGAQEIVQPATPNADRLAEEVRVLARDPRNVRALLSAGEMSARLNDPSAAAGFFARAQALEPGNPRVQAGQAMVMVRMERPGEALRLFDAAARAGLNMDDYASDRGLAYDLIGAQGHAQRDHRVAMRRNPDDETRRRYALSLGISGQDDEAMRVLDPLLKRSDRAAWRARAFIMAMNGDATGADKIAASMMGGFGTALSPFFRRLPALPATDKAFAVHFGEIRRTPQRVADASVAPPLPVLRAEPGVAVAAAQPVRVPPSLQATQPTSRSTRRTQSATGETAFERRQASRRPARQSAAERRAAELEAARLAKQEADRVEAQRVADLRAQQEREALAARQRETERLAAEQNAREAEARRVAEVQARERAAAEEAARLREAARLAEAQRVAEAGRLAAAQTQPAPAPVQQAAAQPVEPVPTPVTSAPPAAFEAPPVQTATAQPSTPPPPGVGREDNVIARIIAGITIPASELGVAPMPGEQRAAAEPAPQTPEPQPQPPPQPAEPVQIARATQIAPKPVAEKPRPEPVAPAKGKPETKVVATKPADAKIKAKATDAKAADAKTKAAEAKAAAANDKAKPAPAKAEQSRQWVQVAGGANVADLPKAWRALVAKAPAEFKGKQAWTTPLRFTNRLLAGPFKTSSEAQAFVNAVGKKGISAFAFASEAGQKVDKLPAN